jgi:peptide/nickel transport system substrate-binding protein
MERQPSKLLSTALCLALFFSTSGCSSKKAATAGGGGQGRDEVVIGFPSIPTHFDPLKGFSSGNQLLFSTLVTVDANQNVVADLAESYQISSDALVYTFNLRADARFSDGTDVKVDDVVFTCQSLMEAATATDLSMVDSITAEQNVVTITLKRPLSTFILTVAGISIVPEHAYSPDFGLNPVGSGPFTLVQFDVDQQFVLQANDSYYGQIPAIRRFVFVKMADEDIRLAAVRAGQVDITLTSAALAATNTVPGYRLLEEASVDNMGIVMPTVPDEGILNQYGAPVGNNITCDVNFRKALAYGIDREAICNDALSGFAVPAFSENDGMPWSNPQSRIEFDLDYAIILLEQSGWLMGTDGVRVKDGQRASITLLYFAGDSVRQAVAMAVSRQARVNLGIEITVSGLAEDAIQRRMFSEPIILAWGSSNPITSYYLFHGSRAGLNDWYNPENFSNPVVDSYLEQALGAPAISDSIPFFQAAQWDGATGTSMRGECPYIFLINKTHLYWVRDELDTGQQLIHAHGDAWPLVRNLAQWTWVDN